MHLTDRDTEIINWITDNKGATIEQINKLFFTNYTTCSIRLKKLSDNKFLKAAVHPVLGKKVYYTKKMPSYHSLILNDFIIKYKDNIKFIQREYKIKKFIVDCIIILKTDKIIIVEIDIYNRTSKEKINGVMAALKRTGVEFEFCVVCKGKRKEEINGVHYIIL
jgi:DNA-binding Lrp family transcriptional regulator